MPAVNIDSSSNSVFDVMLSYFLNQEEDLRAIIARQPR